MVCVSIFAPLLWQSLASAPYFPFADREDDAYLSLESSKLYFELRGELEIEGHDIEGLGGPGRDSLSDERTLGTRSFFVEVDTFSLSFLVAANPALVMQVWLDASVEQLRLGATSLSGEIPLRAGLLLSYGLGFERPVMAVNPVLERHDLMSVLHFRESEMHLRLGLEWTSGSWRLKFGTSVGLARPLGRSPIAESRSVSGVIGAVGFRPATVFSGIGLSFAGEFEVGYRGGYLKVFSSFSELSQVAGIQVLESSLASYASLREELGDESPIALLLGAMLEENFGGLHIRAAILWDRLALLERAIYLLQAGYRHRIWSRPYLHSVAGYLRFEGLKHFFGARTFSDNIAYRGISPAQSTSWNYEILTASLGSEIYRHHLRLRFEYDWIFENSGTTIENQSQIRNNEFRVHIEFRF